MERIFGPLILFVAQFSKEFDKEPIDDLNLITKLNLEHRVIKEMLLKDQKLNSKVAFIIGVLIAHMGLLFWQYERMKDRATKQIKIK